MFLLTEMILLMFSGYMTKPKKEQKVLTYRESRTDWLKVRARMEYFWTFISSVDKNYLKTKCVIYLCCVSVASDKVWWSILSLLWHPPMLSLQVSKLLHYATMHLSMWQPFIHIWFNIIKLNIVFVYLSYVDYIFSFYSFATSGLCTRSI